LFVTSNYHARRARYIFGKVFPPAIAVSVAGAHDGDFDPENWWEKRKSEELFVHEVVGMMVALGRTGSPTQAKNKRREIRYLFPQPRLPVNVQVTIFCEKAALPFTWHKCCNILFFLSRTKLPALDRRL